MNTPSLIQKATKKSDEALAKLMAHDARLVDAETQLKAAEEISKTATRGTFTIEEASKKKAAAQSKASVLKDVLADLTIEREELLASYADAVGAIGDARYETAVAAFFVALNEMMEGLDALKKPLMDIHAADTILSDQEAYKMADEPLLDVIRVWLSGCGREPKLPNRRNLRTFDAIRDFYVGKCKSGHSRKVAIHREKQNRWALQPRGSDAYEAGLKTKLSVAKGRTKAA